MLVFLYRKHEYKDILGLWVTSIFILTGQRESENIPLLVSFPPANRSQPWLHFRITLVI